MERKERRLFLELQEPSCGGDLVPPTVRLEISSVDHLGDLSNYVKSHPITKDPFRLWNLVSNGLIQPMNDNSSVVTCSGQFGDPNSKE